MLAFSKSQRGLELCNVQRTRGHGALCHTWGQEVNPRPVWEWGLGYVCGTQEDISVCPTVRVSRTRMLYQPPSSCAHPGSLQLCSFFCKPAPVPLKEQLWECKQRGVKQLDKQIWKLYLANTVLQVCALLCILFGHVHAFSLFLNCAKSELCISDPRNES